ELRLRKAWGATTNQEIAATLIGFIRTKALGSPLVPYAERVDRALRHVLGSRDWSGSQRQWLQRIAQQIKENTVVDRSTFDREPFRQKGGFARIDRKFDGGLEEVLGTFQDAIWDDAA
ncbi:MAG: type I restriction-modification enzyme R subunit C-terminal domain-containing protein, partial [Bacteroidota bacterium]